MRNILHLITHDKFTAGYINFMKMYMKNQSHHFLVSIYSCSDDESIEGKLVDYDNVIRYKNEKEIAFSKRIRKLVDQADCIIISGFFDFGRSVFFWGKKNYKKMSIQYWGGDFYQYREKFQGDIKKRIFRRLELYVMYESYGAIFLINGEYEKFLKITNIIKTNVFVAEMPGNPCENFDFKKNRNKTSRGKIRLLLGNSATVENRHEHVMELLKKSKIENFEIYCPLVYGDEDYALKIKSKGVEYFGEDFHAMESWMSIGDYYEFLSTCDIGIFGTNRQQGLGNIYGLLRLGKKVYMDKDTSMYTHLTQKGIICYDIDDISKCSCEQFVSYIEKENNLRIIDSIFSVEDACRQWEKVLECGSCK